MKLPPMFDTRNTKALGSAYLGWGTNTTQHNTVDVAFLGRQCNIQTIYSGASSTELCITLEFEFISSLVYFVINTTCKDTIYSACVHDYAHNYEFIGDW